jgi:hypothetical protein
MMSNIFITNVQPLETKSGVFLKPMSHFSIKILNLASFLFMLLLLCHYLATFYILFFNLKTKLKSSGMFTWKIFFKERILN